MYYKNNYKCVNSITHVETYDGETIENKVMRVTENNEPITDGAPLIFTAKKDGVQKGYDIRADKWDIAIDAMNQVNEEKILKATQWMTQQAEEKAKTEETTTKSGDGASVN